MSDSFVTGRIFGVALAACSLWLGRAEAATLTTQVEDNFTCRDVCAGFDPLRLFQFNSNLGTLNSATLSLTTRYVHTILVAPRTVQGVTITALRGRTEEVLRFLEFSSSPGDQYVSYPTPGPYPSCDETVQSGCFRPQTWAIVNGDYGWTVDYNQALTRQILPGDFSFGLLSSPDPVFPFLSANYENQFRLDAYIMPLGWIPVTDDDGVRKTITSTVSRRFTVTYDYTPFDSGPPSEVPVPAAAPLFIFGMAALARAKRRRSNKVEARP